MKRHGYGPVGARVLAVMLSLVLGISAAGASEPGRGQPEGITVHGHWTIEVRNGDGSLESRREIENALIVIAGINGGNSLLAGLLANHYSDPIWIVSLYGPNTTGPCSHEGSPDPWPCRITEARSPFSGTEYSKNLVVGLPVTGMAQTPEGTMALSGSTTAVRDGTLVNVSSEWYVQARNRFGAFTGKTLEPGIPVRAGQIIQVKVVFSFS